MAYSIIAINGNNPDWDEVFYRINRYPKRRIEVFPIETKNGFHLGICIPSRALGIHTWGEFKMLFSTLTTQLGFKLVELYEGEEIRRENLESVKPYIMGAK